MSHWPDATCCFKRHDTKSGLHESTWNMYTQLLGQAAGKTQRIEVMVDELTNKTIRENKQKLVPILATIKLCARQGFPFRGHRDDSK